MATHTGTLCWQVGEFSADLAIAKMPIMSTINKTRLTICSDSFDSYRQAGTCCDKVAGRREVKLKKREKGREIKREREGRTERVT